MYHELFLQPTNQAGSDGCLVSKRITASLDAVERQVERLKPCEIRKCISNSMQKRNGTFSTPWKKPRSMALVYISILCVTSWVSASESSGIRGFQDIKMRLSQLLNANFAVRKSEFQWYCPSEANRQSVELSNPEKHEIKIDHSLKGSKGQPFFQISRHYHHVSFKVVRVWWLWSLSLSWLALSVSCRQKGKCSDSNC